MRKLRIPLLSALAACMFGCSSEPGKTDRERFPDLTGVRMKVEETGVEKKIGDLKAGDVIVAVDGIAYTKQMFDEESALMMQQLRRQGKSAQETMSALSQATPLFPLQFVNRYLLILDGQKRRTPSREALQDAYTKNLEGLKKSRGMTLEQIEDAYPSTNKDMMYRKIAEEIYVRLYAATNIAPVRVVDSNLVAEVKAAIRRSEEESAATNALILAELENLSKKLAGDKEAFAAAANKGDVDPETQQGSGGYLGFAEREQIENKEIAAAVFALKKVGDITKPVVEEDSAFIIQLLSVTPPVTNASGRVVQGEMRETARIYRELEGKPVQMSDAEIWRETDRQMHAQGLSNRISDLTTNGTFKIVYPYGANLF